MSALLKLKPAMDFLRKQTSIIVDGKVIEHCQFGLVENLSGTPALVLLPRADGELRVLFGENDQVTPSIWSTKMIPHRFRGTVGQNIEEAVEVFNRNNDSFKILMVVEFGKAPAPIWELNPTVVRELEMALLAGRVEASRYFLFLDDDGRTNMLTNFGDDYYVLGRSLRSDTLIIKNPVTEEKALQILGNNEWTAC
jgi:hypothetical protein